MYSFSPLSIPSIARYFIFLWTMQFSSISPFVICGAASTFPRDHMFSNSSIGHIQGIMGTVISEITRITFFFFSARYLAIFTEIVVFPQPGLPQTAKTCALRFPVSGSSLLSDLSTRFLPLKFSIYSALPSVSPSGCPVSGSDSTASVSGG